MRQLVDSITSLFRALIMLSILGGGAYLAIEHTPIFEVARNKFSEWQNRQPDYEWGGGAAPAFNAAGDAPPQHTAGHHSATSDAQAWPPVSPRATTEQPATTERYLEQQASFESPAALSPSSPSGEWEYFSLERRLRQMGVNYSMLESDGPDGSRFRFLCRVSLPGGSTKYRKFEAVASQPIEAMRQVIVKVEQWRSYQDLSR